MEKTQILPRPIKKFCRLWSEAAQIWLCRFGNFDLKDVSRSDRAIIVKLDEITVKV